MRRENEFYPADFRIICSATNKEQGGIGFVKSKKTGKRVEDFKKLNDRIIVIRIKSKHKSTMIVNFMCLKVPMMMMMRVCFEEIDETIKQIKGDEILITVGDWNASIGKARKEMLEYGLDKEMKEGTDVLSLLHKI